MIKHNNIYEEIFERMKSHTDTPYINIFAGDDMKKDKKVYSNFYDINNTSMDYIKGQISTHNIGSLGVFMNFNVLSKPKRINDNITKLLYIFIDLDNANENHNELIKTNLEKKGIHYSYNAKSGNGYHFLIPVELDNHHKKQVKGFLEYLRNNVCDKVDVATHTNERLLRCPESTHNKNEKNPIELQTLEYETLPQDIILRNSKEILKYQDEEVKGKKSKEYSSKIAIDDKFFSIFLQDVKNWKTYIQYLKDSEQRNNIFIKNLGIFCHNYSKFISLAQDFVEDFEPARIGALNGWIKKAKLDNMNVNYHELYKWSKEFNLEKFLELLEDQLRTSFLDKYEIYYLEDEKSDSNILLYYPEKNYYVQKSMNEVLINIYFDCKEEGIDLVEEFQMRDLNNKWDELPFKKQSTLLIDQLRRVIEQENRIRLVFNINYEPTDTKFIYDREKKYFNIYNKTALWDYYKHQESYQFDNIKELIMNLCGNDEKNYEWFTHWLAWQIQKPNEKIPTAVIFQGKQGSGKGTFKNLILDNIFGENCQEINQTHLESAFNDYLLGKQIIVANEVMHNENRLTLPNVLKNLITDPDILINIKFKKSIKGSNYTHWIFCTNNDNPVYMDSDDRRYSVFYSEKMRTELGHEIRKNLDYELKEFICYLKDLEVKFDYVSKPIMTDAKKEIIDLNKDSYSRFKEYCSQFYTLDTLFNSLFDYTDSSLVISLDDGLDYITTDKFYLMYEKYCEKFKERGMFAKHTFSKKLSGDGIKSEVKRHNNQTPRWYNKDLIDEIIINPIDKSKNEKDNLLNLLNRRQSLTREDITGELNISSEELETLLLQLKKSGEVFEPRQNEIKRVE